MYIYIYIYIVVFIAFIYKFSVRFNQKVFQTSTYQLYEESVPSRVKAIILQYTKKG